MSQRLSMFFADEGPKELKAHNTETMWFKAISVENLKMELSLDNLTPFENKLKYVLVGQTKENMKIPDSFECNLDPIDCKDWEKSPNIQPESQFYAIVSITTTDGGKVTPRRHTVKVVLISRRSA